jgi:HD-GYP domain-containing protein (c-di-GMP phosphodiesterase class II)
VAEAADFQVIVVGFEPSLLEPYAKELTKLKTFQIKTSADVEAFLDKYQLSPGTTVYVSTNTDGMSHLEIAQALSSYYQGLNLVFVTGDRAKFELEVLKKNGFTESFILPTDQALLKESFATVAQRAQGGAFRRYKAVKLVDISPGTHLPFEVKTFLSLNSKYVTLTGTGEISQKKVDLLKRNHTNSVFVDQAQIEKFYEFAAEQLLALGQTSNDAVSQTEKSERMQSQVRQLFRSVLDSGSDAKDFSVGKDLLEQSKKVVEHFVSQKIGSNLADRLKEVTGEGRDAYSHAQVVSTMACLMSMATGIGQPEDLAIAGLFHDIGILGLNDNTSVFDLGKLSADDQKQYKLHPRNSLNLLKEKRITVTPLVADIIEKHHERMDGKGFPGELQSHRIPVEAHLLAYADAFEYLTRVQPGQPAMKPLAAHEKIAQELSLNPDLLTKMRGFLESAG